MVMEYVAHRTDLLRVPGVAANGVAVEGHVVGVQDTKAAPPGSSTATAGSGQPWAMGHGVMVAWNHGRAHVGRERERSNGDRKRGTGWNNDGTVLRCKFQSWPLPSDKF